MKRCKSFGWCLLLTVLVGCSKQSENGPRYDIDSSGTLAKKYANEEGLLISPFSKDDAKNARGGWAAAKGVDVEFTNLIGMKFTLIPPGTFIMGSPETELSYDDKHLDEEFQHWVVISKPFYLSTTEVTQSQWRAMMGTAPWNEDGKDKLFAKTNGQHAASYVNWVDAMDFCKKLSAQEGKKYRLPTEAEWEYACRAGTQTTYSFGQADDSLGDYAWFVDNAWDAREAYPG